MDNVHYYYIIWMVVYNITIVFNHTPVICSIKLSYDE